MKEAFTYMFKDPRFNDKFMMYFLISFIGLVLISLPEAFKATTVCVVPTITPVTNPMLNVLAFVGSLSQLIFLGYYLTCVKAIIGQNQNIVLPFMNLWNSFVSGFKFNLGIVLLMFILFLIAFLLSFIGKLCVIIFIIFSVLFFIIFVNAFIWFFSNENKILSFFAWKKIVKLVILNKKTYFLNLLILILLGIVSVVVSLLFMLLFNFLVNNVYIALVLNSVEGAIITSYIAFVGMYLVSKSIDYKTVV